MFEDVVCRERDMISKYREGRRNITVVEHGGGPNDDDWLLVSVCEVSGGFYSLT